jgi:hypothetical protein
MTSPFSDPCLSRLSQLSNINGFHFRALDLKQDIATLHAWLNQDYAKFWGMQGMSMADITQALAPTEHKLALMGDWHAAPLFMLELYDPTHDEVGQHYPVMPGDCGMHLIIAPPQGEPIKGLSAQIMDAIARLILDNLGFSRLVVEPDQHNDKIHRLNSLVGIRYQKAIQLSTKVAFLGFCTPEDRQHPYRGLPDMAAHNVQHKNNPLQSNALKALSLASTL